MSAGVAPLRASERFAVALLASLIMLLLVVACALLASAVGAPLKSSPLRAPSWQWVLVALMAWPVGAVLILAMWHVLDMRHRVRSTMPGVERLVN